MSQDIGDRWTYVSWVHLSVLILVLILVVWWVGSRGGIDDELAWDQGDTASGVRQRNHVIA